MTQRHPPAPTLLTGVLLAGGVGVLIVMALALAARAWLPMGGAYPVRSAAIFAAMAALVSALVGAHHRYPTFGPANQVTLARAALVALLAGLIGEPRETTVAAAAVVVAVIVIVLDGADGWLARRSGMVSGFGARFDMETDALFVMVLSVLVWQYGKAGAWVLAGGLLRYAFVASGWFIPWMAGPLRPTRRARVITVCHVTGLIVALAPIIPMPLSAIGVAGTLSALGWSFVVDVRRLHHAA